MSKAVLPKSVLALAALAANESQVRFSATTCVKVKSSGGNFRAEATNGRYLGIMNGYADGDVDMLIDAAKMAEIKKVMAKDHEFVMIETNDGKRFTAGGTAPLRFTQNGEVIPYAEPVSKIGGEYKEENDDGARWPNTDQVIPSGKVACTFMVDPAMLIDLLRVAQSVANGEACGVTFTVFRKPGDNPREQISTPIGLSCRNDDGTVFFDGVLVPIVRTK